jgi:hypothetical protein
MTIAKDVAVVSQKVDSLTSTVMTFIKASEDSRERIHDKLGEISTRVAILEHIDETTGKPAIAPAVKPQSTLEKVGMWAGLLVGIPTIATVMQAVWSSVGHFIDQVAHK